MSTSKIVLILSLALITIMGVSIVGKLISFSNTEISIRNRYDQKMTERTAFYDKMYKTLAQKSQITLKNDSSFARNVNAIMSGRKDSDQLFMKWVTESNPNANYDQVSALYQELSRTVESERNGFFTQEKVIQGVVLEHTNHIGLFPNSFINSLLFNRQKINYKPITSDRTDDVMSTGKDNNVKLF